MAWNRFEQHMNTVRHCTYLEGASYIQPLTTCWYLRCVLRVGRVFCKTGLGLLLLGPGNTLDMVSE
jgi:hypothetical protein